MSELNVYIIPLQCWIVSIQLSILVQIIVFSKPSDVGILFKELFLQIMSTPLLLIKTKMASVVLMRNPVIILIDLSGTP